MYQNPKWTDYFYVKAAAGKTSEAIASAQAVFEKACPGKIFKYQFVDEEYDALYKTESRIGALFNLFASLLSRDFVKLVLLSFLLAVPIGWWASTIWLADFAYRINLQWWMFAVAGLAALLVAFASVSIQTLKAALSNPVGALRNE